MQKGDKKYTAKDKKIVKEKKNLKKAAFKDERITVPIDVSNNTGTPE